MALGVKGATTATIYISAATNFVNYQDVSGDASLRATHYQKEAIKRPYSELLSRHREKYQSQFGRVSFTLPSTLASLQETDKRVADFEKGNDQNLAALLFQYGRYLLISSSQLGGQPANL